MFNNKIYIDPNFSGICRNELNMINQLNSMFPDNNTVEYFLILIAIAICRNNIRNKNSE